MRSMRASERHASLPLGLVSPPKSERDRHKVKGTRPSTRAQLARLRAERQSERERDGRMNAKHSARRAARQRSTITGHKEEALSV
ncbi:hypothetical protein EVAR_3509_1 [Eumeta japonica]|uniref:Uncharacterized protein n=1 Tax=Eumeta variegata TaxID=151549 RepID=A0A4C1YY60_EUMVA|nr:hypothetical protein EVAR_3509_1 [Eumeta japonica]